MANFRTPGPVCASNAPPFDSGTLVRWWSPSPGSVCLASSPAVATRQWHNYSRAGGFIAAMLTMSPEAVSLLKAIETLRLKPYDDQTGKEISAWVEGATVGYGHLIGSSDWDTYKDGITEAQADALFREDATPYETTVGAAITATVQQYEFDAMVILAFNIGRKGFRDSSVVKLVNDPKAKTSYPTLESAWKSWNKSQGKVNNGVVNRRAAEWRIYTTAVYARW